jgi:competence protein ComEC
MGKRAHYFFAATLSFFLGVAWGSLDAVGMSEGLLVAALAVATLSLYYTGGRRSAHLLFFVICTGVALGALRYELAYTQVPHDLDAFESHTVTLQGVVIREPDMRERSTQLVVEVKNISGVEATGVVLVFHERLSEVAYGDTVEVAGTLTLPKSFETDFGRAFEYRTYLLAQGIDHTMTYPKVTVLESGAGSEFVAMLLSFKQKLSSAIDTALRAPEAGVAKGILLGEKQALGKELLASFRDAGLIHIVVLSGYNIAIMIEACMKLLSFLSLRIRCIIGSFIIVCFVLMVGLSATVLRAAIMATLVLIARATGRTYDILRALILAGVLMVSINPFLLMYDPGFQLSFLATLGLIVLVPLLERSTTWLPTLAGAKDFFLSTLAAQIMTFPLIAYIMGSVSLVAIVANVAVLPFIPLAMLLTTIVGCVGLISAPAAFTIGYPAYLVLKYVVALGEVLGNMSHASVALPPFSFAWVVALYIGIGISIGVFAMHKKPPSKPHASMGDPIPF